MEEGRAIDEAAVVGIWHVQDSHSCDKSGTPEQEEAAGAAGRRMWGKVPLDAWRLLVAERRDKEEEGSATAARHRLICG